MLWLFCTCQQHDVPYLTMLYKFIGYLRLKQKEDYCNWEDNARFLLHELCGNSRYETGTFRLQSGSQGYFMPMTTARTSNRFRSCRNLGAVAPWRFSYFGRLTHFTSLPHFNVIISSVSLHSQVFSLILLHWLCPSPWTAISLLPVQHQIHCDNFRRA
jgi:hypothetical protein